MLYFFDVFGPSQGLVDRDKVPVSVFELAQLLDELVVPVIVCQRARVFSIIVMVIVSRMLLSGFFVFWFVVVFMSCVLIDYGCVVELIGTSPCIALYFPLSPPLLCLLGKVLPSACGMERASSWPSCHPHKSFFFGIGILLMSLC